MSVSYAVTQQQLRESYENWAMTASQQDQRSVSSLIQLIASSNSNQGLEPVQREVAFKACMLLTRSTAASIPDIVPREIFYSDSLIPFLASNDLNEAALLVNQLTIPIFRAMGLSYVLNLENSPELLIEIERAIQAPKWSYEGGEVLANILKHNRSYLKRALILFSSKVLKRSVQVLNKDLSLDELNQFKLVAKSEGNPTLKDEFLSEIATAEAEHDPNLAMETAKDITYRRAGVMVAIAKRQPAYFALAKAAIVEIEHPEYQITFFCDLATVDTSIQVSEIKELIQLAHSNMRDYRKYQIIDLELFRNRKEDAERTMLSMASIDYKAQACIKIAQTDSSYLGLAKGCLRSEKIDYIEKQRMFRDFVRVEVHHDPLQAIEDVAKELQENGYQCTQSEAFLDLVNVLAPKNFALALAVTLKIKNSMRRAKAFMTLAMIFQKKI